MLAPFGIRDRLHGVCAAAPRVEVYLALDRLEGSREFGTRECEVMLAAAGHLAWFFRRLARGFGVPGPRLPRLTPREAQTLRGLLTAHSEKRIASDLGIAASTLHEYVTSVYRKLEVASRPELMARFVGRPLPLLGHAGDLPTFSDPSGLPLTITAATSRDALYPGEPDSRRSSSREQTFPSDSMRKGL